MALAIKVENLSKCFRLGQTFENTLSSRLGELFRFRRGQQRRAPEDFWALKDLSFELAEGEALGIVGANGAGKSTLLKILSRITPPTSGRALVKGRLSSLLEVGTGFHPELTGRENVFLNGAILGMRTREVQAKFDEIVAFAGVERFIDTPVKRYSSGMYVRLAFAVAAHLEPDVLVIDEVLAVGDAEFQKRCLGKMGDVASEGRTVVFVSHNMAAVEKLCGRAIWIQDGMLSAQGPCNEVIANYLRSTQRLQEQATLEPGYLYVASGGDESADATVLSVQLLNEQGQPMDAARTWEAATLRIGFAVNRRYRSFSAVIEVNTTEGQTLMLTSSTPDQTVSFGVEPGSYVIDCDISSVPMAAGEYTLGIGLAIPGVEYVWRRPVLCRLNVHPVDVYGSGLPPASNRYLVAARHEWRAPERASTE